MRFQAHPSASFFFLACTLLSLPGAGRAGSGEGPARNTSSLPADLSRYRPLPLPAHKPHTGEKKPVSEGRWVTFDPTTRTEVLEELGVRRDEPAPGVSSGEVEGSPRAPGKGGPPELPSPQNFSGLGLVADPTSGDYPNHVKLFVSVRDTGGTLRYFVGSGTLIDPFHVLTAGHMLYFHTDDGYTFNDWVESVTVVPAYENGSRPFGDAAGVQLHSWTGWINDADFDHDVGLIDLDRPIGALTGWRGYGWSDDCDYFSGGTWEHDGYPAEGPYDGNFMYTQTGNFDGCETVLGVWYGNEVSYDRRTYGGQSGSGAVRSSVVRAVLTNGNASTTWDTRVTSGKYSDISGFIDTDRPASADLIPLTVTISPGTITSGRILSDIDFKVHNYSDVAWNGLVNYDIYLSANDNISVSDVLMRSGSFNTTIAARGTISVDAVLPTIPAATASGNYYVGVILDVADASSANNDSDGQDAAPLTVNFCATLADPTLASPANGTTCLNPASVLLNWNDVPNADSYRVQIGTACGSGTVYYTPNASSVMVVYDLSPGTTYYWRVLAENDCGNASLWSFCNSFTTSTATPGVATLQDPSDGATCQSTTVTLDWLPLGSATSYEVQIGTACGAGSIVTRNFSDYTASGFTTATTYYWRVRGRNACGTFGNWSACASFTTVPAAPGATTLLAPADGETCVGPIDLLSWQAVPGALAYRVEVSGACGAGGSISPPQPLTEVHVGDFPLPPGTYFWRVQAFTTCSVAGPWSGCRSFTLDPIPPSNVTAVSTPGHQKGVWSADATVHAQWSGASDAACGIAGYSLAWDQNAKTVPDALADTAADSTTSPPLPDGTGNWFHLRAIDGAGNPSAETTTIHLGPFWIDRTAPTASVLEPNGGETWPCRVAGYTSTRTIRWSAADTGSGIQSIELRYSTDGGVTFPYLIATPAASDTSYEWTIPETNTTAAMVKIVVADQVGNVSEDVSNAVFELRCRTTDTENAPPVTAFELDRNVPNPFNPTTTIGYALPVGTRVQLRIFSAQGRMVRELVNRFQEGPARYTVTWDGTGEDGARAASGTYFYQLHTPEFTRTQRMVLIK